VPNFAQLKSSDPVKLLPGYDYDVISAEALNTRVQVQDARLVLPDGMSYRVLVLPDRQVISLPVLRKLKALVAAGATIIGPKPTTASGLQDFPQSDAEVAQLAAEVWGDCDGDQVREHSLGKGRVIWGKTAREVLQADGVPPDCEIREAPDDAQIDYIHRRTEGTEIYFVANRADRPEEVRCAFRVTDKAPELWNAVTGEHRLAAAYEQQGPVTTIPLSFAPCGSWFVVFREPAGKHPATASSNSIPVAPCQEIGGPWTVKFDPKWGGPAEAVFADLVSWTTRTESGIKYYSGTATYHKTFEVAATRIASGRRLWLDLGDVRQLAEVRLNGRQLGIVWAPPFRVNITAAVQPGTNRLEVDIVNFWPNRIIGDHSLPAEQRFTRTNVRKLTKDTPLMDSGLLGPVRLLTEESPQRTE
jgi:hypothetical protein